MSKFYTTFLSKSDFSFALMLVTFQLLEVEQSYIPLLKALMCGINTVGAQGCGYMFTFCHVYLKTGVLLHKMAIVCNQKFMAVYTYIFKSVKKDIYFSSTFLYIIKNNFAYKISLEKM